MVLVLGACLWVPGRGVSITDADRPGLAAHHS